MRTDREVNAGMLERYEKLIHQGELPRLEIVPLSKILLHEEIESGRLRRVAARIEEDGALRHPPIVAKVPRSPKLLLLDGAHRTIALKELAVRNVLVQVVDYEDRLIELQRWHHLVSIEEVEHFLDRVNRIPGTRIAWHRTSSNASPFYMRKNQYAQLLLPDRNSILLLPEKPLDRSGPSWLAGVTSALQHICGLYKERGFLDRISYDEFDLIEANYPHFSSLIAFPHFTKKEISSIARLKQKLPAGITRHLIPKRVLRFNLPLWVLSRDLPTEELNRRLVEMILSRIRDGRIRFYSESTFSFDE
jgi:hypothetical protein